MYWINCFDDFGWLDWDVFVFIEGVYCCIVIWVGLFVGFVGWIFVEDWVVVVDIGVVWGVVDVFGYLVGNDFVKGVYYCCVVGKLYFIEIIIGGWCLCIDDRFFWCGYCDCV